MTVASQIADFVFDTQYEDMPADALLAAKVAVLDTLGATLAGVKEESGRISAEIARQEGAGEQSSVVGQGFRSSALQAAFANGTASHAADFDFSFAVLGQPMAPVVSAAFAMGEVLGASGRQVLEAYVAGFEVTAKLAFAMLGAPADGFHGAGFHANNSLGSFGATAACVKLLGMDAARIEMAIAITASMASGLRANFGTMTKPLHVGLAARNGVLAAKLAAAGFTANEKVIESRSGFFDAFYPGGEFNDAPIAELGRSFALVSQGVRVKPYPCGGLTHSAIDAVLRMREAYELTADMIEKVEVEVPRSTYQTIVFRVPEDELQGKFCMGYLIARALIDGRITLDTFTENAIRDPDVLSLLHRVEMHIDTNLEAGSDGGRPATVTVYLRNGETHRSHERFARGSAAVPLTQAELHMKFRDCAAGVMSDANCDQTIRHLEKLETLDDIRPLMNLLRDAQG